jgi:hypothetical protein
MEHIFISNGTTQLVLVPENEIDRLLLDKILSEGPVEIEYIRQPVGILGKSVKDGVIIRKKTNYDSSQTESMQWMQTDETDLEEPRQRQIL